MPERPDLEHWVPELHRQLVGRQFLDLRIVKPTVLRCLFAEPPGEWLGRQVVTKVFRHGPFVAIETQESLIRIHPMLAGRFTFAIPSSKAPADLALAFVLDDGRELRYRDDVQMGKVYLSAKHQEIPGWPAQGLDPLSEQWIETNFSKLLARRQDQLKNFLLDHAAVDCFGNAYADEVCWEAQLHPKVRIRELSPPQRLRLFEAIPTVLRNAIDEIARRKPPLDEKLRDFLAVRGKKGECCRRCNTPIRTCGVNGYDAFFCPHCQPDEKGRTLVDWHRTN